ncbi:FAD-binding domain-containing protein [Loktanella salsilacus]|uniref:FAD-binding domain-containing protein n=1 Tax=Loktanella salsilacus TaxID=195913 RepID=UPI0037365FD4
MTDFTPTRAAGLDRLSAFAPHAAVDYARTRNFDTANHENVSRLSPWLRHGLLTEAEVIAAALRHHGPDLSEKFVTEVTWRLYFKGWLELRPQIWADYQSERRAAWNDVQTQSGLRRRWEQACTGQTGIDCFDHWATELVRTGYLHNHARMWFASIWIFTLELPWVLGADLFLRHLLDGDAASNTLSWRWVAGLHTRGKTYLATADNIARYTNGRFNPDGLAQTAPALDGPPLPAPRPCPVSDPFDPAARSGLLLTDETLFPDPLLGPDLGLRPVATATVQASHARTHLLVSDRVTQFSRGAIDDCTLRLSDQLGPVTGCTDLQDIVTWARAAKLDQVVMQHVPTGPAADTLAGLRQALDANGITLSVQMRPIDQLSWPQATAGFFKFKRALPDIMACTAATKLP